jgi:hypothetical protein
MKKFMAMLGMASLLTVGTALAQDAMKPDAPKDDTMKSSDAMKASKVTGKISDDGKTFVSDTDSKSWAIDNPDAVKGHEGHHVTLTAMVDNDKSAVHVKSLKMAK